MKNHSIDPSCAVEVEPVSNPSCAVKTKNTFDYTIAFGNATKAEGAVIITLAAGNATPLSPAARRSKSLLDSITDSLLR